MVAAFGAERLGCTVVPISGGNTERQLKIMRDFGATALSCTPSYAMYLGDAARDRGLRRHLQRGPERTLAIQLH